MRGRHRFLLLLPLVAVTAILRVPPLPAETEAGPDVLALVVPLDASAETFAAVVTGVLEPRLKSTGLKLDIRTLHLSDGAKPGDALAGQGTPTAAAVLTCRFSVVGQEMTAAMDWRDVQTRTRRAISEKAPIDLSLDDFILRVLDQLLVQVQDRIDEMAAKRRDTALAAAAASAKAADAAPTAVRPQELPPAPGRPTTEGETGATRFLLSTGFAPFIPVGAASSSFNLGFSSCATGSIIFPVPSGWFGVGVSAGVVSFTAQGAAASASSYLIPLGLDASYHLRGRSMAGLFLDLGGGAAVLFVSGPALGTRAKTVPFLRGKVGLELLSSRSVGIVLDAGYEVYFEMPLVIMGVSPALEISLTL